MLFSSYSASGLAESSPTQCMHIINPSLGRGRVCGGIECGMRARRDSETHATTSCICPLCLCCLAASLSQSIDPPRTGVGCPCIDHSIVSDPRRSRPSDREVPQAGLDAWLGSMNERTLSPCTHPHPYICVVEYPHLTAKK